MYEAENLLVTGGSGLLGRELRTRLPRACFPDRKSFDVTNYNQLDEYVRKGSFDTLLHAAAFTSPPMVESHPEKAIAVNIVGTSNIATLCMVHDLRLIYISTDYVFSGRRGDYTEDDSVLPVNKYAWSKLGGECAVRMIDTSLIIRTSFGPNEFPFPKAFTDQWTSRLAVAEFADLLVRVVQTDLTGTLHIGGPRRTVHSYAQSLNPGEEIGELRRSDVPFEVPKDTSLNCSRMGKVLGDGSRTKNGRP